MFGFAAASHSADKVGCHFAISRQGLKASLGRPNMPAGGHTEMRIRLSDPLPLLLCLVTGVVLNLLPTFRGFTC